MPFHVPHLVSICWVALFCIGMSVGPGVAGSLNKLPPELQEPFMAKVVGVHDGDTVTLLSESEMLVKIRFSQADAPELKQPYGQKSKHALSAMVFGRTVMVLPEEVDKYNRLVATLLVDGVDANRAMVEGGHAWAFRQYLRDPGYLILESRAREAKKGLWALQADQVIAPWEYRAAKREKRPPQPWVDPTVQPLEPPQPTRPWYKRLWFHG